MINATQVLNPKLGKNDIEQAATRDGFGNAILDLGKNEDIVVLTGDLAESTRVDKFAKTFPERFIDVGVAEQNMMGTAAGLALAGKTSFVTSYATFSPGRNWDQLRVSVCYSKANVKVIGCHAGLSVGPDGATHQALEDIAITRVLPNLDVVIPIDSIEAEKATRAISITQNPSYLRLTREKTPIITTQSSPFQMGRANLLKDGGDIGIIGCGPVLYNALMAAMELEKEGINVSVLNVHTIKPLDKIMVGRVAQVTKAVVTIEEHQIAGGLGSAVAEYLSETDPVLIERMGVNDSFGQSGEPDQLYKFYGLDIEAIKKRVRDLYQKKLRQGI